MGIAYALRSHRKGTGFAYVATDVHFDKLPDTRRGVNSVIHAEIINGTERAP